MKLQDFNYKNIESVDVICKVLRYLNTGNELKIGGYCIRLAEHDNGNIGIVCKLDIIENQKPSTTWVLLSEDTNIIYSLYKKEQNKEELMFLISANTVLNKIKNK